MHMYHPVVNQIIALLKDHNCWHETFAHAPVTTSEEASKVRPEYSLSQGAKALIVKIDKKEGSSFAQLVLPGDLQLDNKKVKQSLSCKSFRFATLDEVATKTGGIERGGVPPFGNLFSLPVYVDPHLFTHEKIIFNAGDKSFSIAMKSADYRMLVSPFIVSLTN